MQSENSAPVRRGVPLRLVQMNVGEMVAGANLATQQWARVPSAAVGTDPTVTSFWSAGVPHHLQRRALGCQSLQWVPIPWTPPSRALGELTGVWLLGCAGWQAAIAGWLASGLR